MTNRQRVLQRSNDVNGGDAPSVANCGSGGGNSPAKSVATAAAGQQGSLTFGLLLGGGTTGDDESVGAHRQTAAPWQQDGAGTASFSCAPQQGELSLCRPRQQGETDAFWWQHCCRWLCRRETAAMRPHWCLPDVPQRHPPANSGSPWSGVRIAASQISDFVVMLLNRRIVRWLRIVGG